MQVVALNWHVYLLTGSPLALGLVGLTRVVPIIIFSLWGGILADRRDRKRIMLVSQSAHAASCRRRWPSSPSAGRPPCSSSTPSTRRSGAASAFDNPARQALVPRLVPPGELPSAMALMLAMTHVAFIGGPGLAGLLLAGGAAIAPGAATPAMTTAATAQPDRGRDHLRHRRRSRSWP